MKGKKTEFPNWAVYICIYIFVSLFLCLGVSTCTYNVIRQALAVSCFLNLLQETTTGDKKKSEQKRASETNWSSS